MVAISTLENGNVRVHISCALKSGSVRKYFAMPDEDGNFGSADESQFVQILAKAFVWKELLSSGTYHDKTALAKALGLCKQNLQMLLKLPYLSPIIVENVLAGELTDASVAKYQAIALLPWHE